MCIRIHLVGMTSIVMLAGLLLTGLHASAQIEEFKPVTDAMLQNPDPADWLNWRRTLDAWGYSPLDQINTENVHELELVWSWAMRSGTNQPTPLVYGGVMYLPNPGGSLQALDAVTGNLLWQYASGAPPPPPSDDDVLQNMFPGLRAGGRPPPPPDRGGGAHRSIAIYDDKIYLATDRVHLVALEARTGKVVWDQAVAETELGWAIGSGPVIANGTVVVGLDGCQRYKEEPCFISGHDPQTGKESWRVHTIARPGEPGGDTWGDLPLMFRAGSDTWISGSYDPKTNLIYWGTAQAKPWVRAVRGTDGDALYTNSALAINPDTGEMVWYYQHIPGETQDMDEVFESILVDYDGRSSLFKMGKLGILWELDRTTGKFVAARDAGYQNILERVDPQTGKVTYRPDAIPQIGVEMDMCPTLAGFKSWRAMAYHPETQAFYIPMLLACERNTFGPMPPPAEGGGGIGPVKREAYFHPASPEAIGEFLAMDMRTGKALWRHRTRTPPTSAALTTGGGLAVVGDWDRYVYILDAASGKVLFQTRMPSSVQGFPITYAVRGKQYLAIPVGTGGGSWSSIMPVMLTPEKSRPPPRANAIFVFALPDRLTTQAR